VNTHSDLVAKRKATAGNAHPSDRLWPPCSMKANTRTWACIWSYCFLGFRAAKAVDNVARGETTKTLKRVYRGTDTRGVVSRRGRTRLLPAAVHAKVRTFLKTQNDVRGWPETKKQNPHVSWRVGPWTRTRRSTRRKNWADDIVFFITSLLQWSPPVSDGECRKPLYFTVWPDRVINKEKKRRQNFVRFLADVRYHYHAIAEYKVFSSKTQTSTNLTAT